MADEGFILYFDDVGGRREFYYIPTEEEFNRLRWKDDFGSFEGEGIYYIEEERNHCGDFDYRFYKLNDKDVNSLFDFCERVKNLKSREELIERGWIDAE